MQMIERVENDSLPGMCRTYNRILVVGLLFRVLQLLCVLFPKLGLCWQVFKSAVCCITRLNCDSSCKCANGHMPSKPECNAQVVPQANRTMMVVTMAISLMAIASVHTVC